MDPFPLSPPFVLPPTPINTRELDFAGVYRVPAASLQTLGTTPEGKGAPDVELITKGIYIHV